MNFTEPQQVLALLLEIKTLISKTNPWIPMWSVLGGAALGGLISMLTTWRIELSKRKHESHVVGCALVAEISALLTIIEARQYLEHFEKVITHLKNQPRGASAPLVAKIPEHYSQVYQKHVDRLGCLDPRFAAEIIHFHQLVDAVVQDVIPGGALQTEYATLEAYTQSEKILRKAITIGKSIMQRPEFRASH